MDDRDNEQNIQPPKFRLIAIIIIAVVFGIFLHYISWQMAVMHGQIIGRQDFIAFHRDFTEAMKSRVPFDIGEWRIYPHTDAKIAQVRKRKR